LRRTVKEVNVQTYIQCKRGSALQGYIQTDMITSEDREPRFLSKGPFSK